jgi:hypothetical protein
MDVGQAAPAALGFLTVVEHAELGLCGGYLLLNRVGRPLEFHCTTPVKANRAQEILYGPTLKPYLYGELIAAALIQKGKVPPLAVLTDEPAVLAVQSQTPCPLALVEGDATASDHEADERAGTVAARSNSILRRDASHAALPRLVSLTVGRRRLSVVAGQENARDELARRVSAIDEDFDLREPFDRIREAIQEAQRGGRA